MYMIIIYHYIVYRAIRRARPAPHRRVLSDDAQSFKIWCLAIYLYVSRAIYDVSKAIFGIGLWFCGESRGRTAFRVSNGRHHCYYSPDSISEDVIWRPLFGRVDFESFDFQYWGWHASGDRFWKYGSLQWPSV